MSRMTMIASAVLVMASAVLGGAQEKSDVEAVRAVSAAYGMALNAASVDDVMALFASDAVLMPANAPTQVGQQAIREYYRNRTFASSYDVTLTVAEVVTMSDWAFARIDASGTSAPRAGGTSARLDIKYIFIMHKGGDDSWKIARLIFNRNLPLAAP